MAQLDACGVETTMYLNGEGHRPDGSVPLKCTDMQCELYAAERDIKIVCDGRVSLCSLDHVVNHSFSQIAVVDGKYLLFADVCTLKSCCEQS